MIETAIGATGTIRRAAFAQLRPTGMRTADTVAPNHGCMMRQGGGMNQEERERRIFRLIAGTMLAVLLTYGFGLIAYQSFNAKKRAGLPQTITLLQQ
jgi:hypothetical protein